MEWRSGMTQDETPEALSTLASAELKGRDLRAGMGRIYEPLEDLGRRLMKIGSDSTLFMESHPANDKLGNDDNDAGITTDAVHHATRAQSGLLDAVGGNGGGGEDARRDPDPQSALFTAPSVLFSSSLGDVLSEGGRVLENRSSRISEGKGSEALEGLVQKQLEALEEIEKGVCELRDYMKGGLRNSRPISNPF